jgi:hypothetical protein
MSRLRNKLIVLAAVGILAVVGSLMNSRRANAQSGSLRVTIGAPLPVPVSITGSSTISGTVGLASGASVRVNNTVTDPVRVSNVNDAIQPFQASNFCSGTAGTGGCAVTIFTVPAGKRAVVEYYNGSANFANVAAAGQVFLVDLRTTVAGQAHTHYLPPTPPAVSNLTGPGAGTSWGQQVRLYADSGTTILGDGLPSITASPFNLTFNISGYLVDVPLTR